MGDVIDSTLMHINDLPIPIPIHQQGLSLTLAYYFSRSLMQPNETKYVKLLDKAYLDMFIYKT